MITMERKAKAREIADQYFKEAKWWLDNVGGEDPRTTTCCSQLLLKCTKH